MLSVFMNRNQYVSMNNEDHGNITGLAALTTSFRLIPYVIVEVFMEPRVQVKKSTSCTDSGCIFMNMQGNKWTGEPERIILSAAFIVYQRKR